MVWLRRAFKEDRQTRRKARTPDLSGRLVTIVEPGSVAAETYRTLRTNLFHAFVDEPPKVIVLTSAGPREGKSTTCANLGVTLGKAGKNTLIIDCDFRKPELHRYFGISNTWGIVDVLEAGHNLQEAWAEPVDGLKVVPVGSIPPNPSELLDSRVFAQLLARVREDFDFVLLDTPPVGLVSDAVILASWSDGVLFVMDAQNTRRVALRQSVSSLNAVGANVIGVVMNNVKQAKNDYYYGYPNRKPGR